MCNSLTPLMVIRPERARRGHGPQAPQRAAWGRSLHSCSFPPSTHPPLTVPLPPPVLRLHRAALVYELCRRAAGSGAATSPGMNATTYVLPVLHVLPVLLPTPSAPLVVVSGASAGPGMNAANEPLYVPPCTASPLALPALGGTTIGPSPSGPQRPSRPFAHPCGSPSIRRTDALLSFPPPSDIHRSRATAPCGWLKWRQDSSRMLNTDETLFQFVSCYLQLESNRALLVALSRPSLAGVPWQDPCACMWGRPQYRTSWPLAPTLCVVVCRACGCPLFSSSPLVASALLTNVSQLPKSLACTQCTNILVESLTAIDDWCLILCPRLPWLALRKY